jgi:hypothetical protein
MDWFAFWICIAVVAGLLLPVVGIVIAFALSLLRSAKNEGERES